MVVHHQVIVFSLPPSIDESDVKLTLPLMAKGGRIGSRYTPEPPKTLRGMELEYELAGSYRREARRKCDCARESGEDEDRWTNNVI